MYAPEYTNAEFNVKYTPDIYDKQGRPYGQMISIPIAGAPDVTHDCLMAHIYKQKNGKHMLAISNASANDIYKVVSDFPERDSAIYYAYDWAKANVGFEFLAMFATAK